MLRERKSYRLDEEEGRRQKKRKYNKNTHTFNEIRQKIGQKNSKSQKNKKKKLTTPGIPKPSPIQVLTGPNVA